MNILMTLSQLEVTGAEVYAATIADELIRRGNNVYIISDTFSTKTKSEYSKLEFNKRSIFNRFSHVRMLYNFIKKNDIHIVHAHSRAASWSSSIACKLAKIPLITTTHGKQPIHFSRKLIKAFGDHSIAVCENVKDHMVNDINFSSDKVSVIRNPILFDKINIENSSISTKKTISIIGRLSGPKGKVTYDLLNLLTKNLSPDEYEINVIGGSSLPEEFTVFQEKGVKFLGYIDELNKKITSSDVVIGAGRVALESILLSVPTIAIGESQYIGLIRNNNLNKALSSNFGDISSDSYPNLDEGTLIEDLKNALLLTDDEKEYLYNQVSSEVNLKDVVNKIENLYFKLYVNKKKYEIPILMYHRVINNSEDEGVHGTYIYEKDFEKHMEYLHKNNYITLTFKDLIKMNWRNRFDKNKKYIFITFDDGYEDNYKLAFPILKKFNFKATIF